MKAKVGNFNLEWLLASHPTNRSDGEDACIVQETKYNIPPEFGEAFLGRLELGEGIELFRAVHHLEQAPTGEMIALLDVHADHIEHAFNAQIWLSGVGCHHEYWNGRSESPTKVSAGPGRDTFRFARKMDATVQVIGGETSEMRAVHVPESTLSSLIGDSALNYLLKNWG